MENAAPGLELAPYVPRILAEWDLDAPGARWREVEGTCCFVDISGFSALFDAWPGGAASAQRSSPRS